MASTQFQTLKAEEPWVVPTLGLDELWSEVFETLRDAPNSDRFVQHIVQDKYGVATEGTRQGRLQHAADALVNGAILEGQLTVRIHDGVRYFRLPTSVFYSMVTTDQYPEMSSFTTWANGRLHPSDTTPEFQWIVDGKFALVTTHDNGAAVRLRLEYLTRLLDLTPGEVRDTFPAIADEERRRWEIDFVTRPHWEFAEVLLWIALRNGPKISDIILHDPLAFHLRNRRDAGWVNAAISAYCADETVVEFRPLDSLMRELIGERVLAFGYFDGETRPRDIRGIDWAGLEFMDQQASAKGGTAACLKTQIHGVPWRGHWTDIRFYRESVLSAFEPLPEQERPRLEDPNSAAIRDSDQNVDATIVRLRDENGGHLPQNKYADEVWKLHQSRKKRELRNRIRALNPDSKPGRRGPVKRAE